jgi:hypothetical protein
MHSDNVCISIKGEQMRLPWAGDVWLGWWWANQWFLCTLGDPFVALPWYMVGKLWVWVQQRDDRLSEANRFAFGGNL